MKLPPLDIDDLLIVYRVFCEGEPQSQYQIETQGRYYGFPLAESLDILVKDGYFERCDEEGNLVDNGHYYKLTKAAEEWAEGTFKKRDDEDE